MSADRDRRSGGRTKEAGSRDRWKPVPTTRRDLEAFRLTPFDAYVLSRIDGITSVHDLAMILAMEVPSLWTVLEGLAREGAIQAPPAAAVPPAVEAPPAAAPADPEGEPAERPTALEGTHRQLFETKLHALPEDARAALAARAGEPELSALCFDSTPGVVRAVLENPRAGLPHARLIAAHHGNAAGLDALGAKAGLLHDVEVQRLLFRNPQTPAPLLQGLLSRRRLADVYHATQSRELPERNRKNALQTLRRRFTEVGADERVDLIVRTEGRALAALTGLTLDGRSAALLCAKPFASVLLIENLARWPATPPPVIAHLLKQPLLRQMPPLRALVKRHPNCPPSAS